MATETEAEAMKSEPIEKEDEKPQRAEHLCCYSQKECTLEKLKGFDFCHKHILEDKASPFKPCSFVSKTNGKKCTNPAPNLPGKGKTYCLIHTKDSELRKAVEERSLKKRKRKHSDQSEITEPVIAKQAAKKHKINEDEHPKRDEMLRVDSSWHGDHESDTESLDNEIDEPLRHAGVWTAEEVTKVCRDKLLRLRSLYMSQFERLKHVFKNKRRKYILAKKATEVEGDTNVVKNVSSFDIALKGYNKRYRTDALLQKQSKERRLGTTSKNHQILPHQRCTHYTDGNRCVYRVVPSTKFCIKHICHDPNQVLFLPCSHVQGDNKHCGTPVPNVLTHDKCLFHLPHDHLTGESLQEKLEKAKELQRIKDENRHIEKLQSTSTTTNESVVKVEPKSPCDVAPEVTNPKLSSHLASAQMDKAPLPTTNNTLTTNKSSSKIGEQSNTNSQSTVDILSSLNNSSTTNSSAKATVSKQPTTLSSLNNSSTTNSSAKATVSKQPITNNPPTVDTPSSINNSSTMNNSSTKVNEQPITGNQPTVDKNSSLVNSSTTQNPPEPTVNKQSIMNNPPAVCHSSFIRNSPSSKVHLTTNPRTTATAHTTTSLSTTAIAHTTTIQRKTTTSLATTKPPTTATAHTTTSQSATATCHITTNPRTTATTHTTTSQSTTATTHTTTSQSTTATTHATTIPCKTTSRATNPPTTATAHTATSRPTTAKAHTTTSLPITNAFHTTSKPTSNTPTSHSHLNKLDVPSRNKMAKEINKEIEQPVLIKKTIHNAGIVTKQEEIKKNS